MENVTSQFKEDIRTHGRQFDFKVKINNDDVDADNFFNIKPSFNADLFKTIMHKVEISSKNKLEKNDEINVEIGVKANQKQYEYISYNTCKVNSSERQEDTLSFVSIAYDKMHEAMIDYDLELTEKIQVREYLIKICERLGWDTQYIPATFINSEKLVDTTLHQGIGYTFRDVLDEIATISFSFILFIGDKFYLMYPTETNESINDTYLDEDNVSIGEKIFFNSLVFARAEESDIIFRKDDTSIEINGLHEYRISDNQLLSTNDRDLYIDEMFEYLKTFEFYTFDIKSKGILFLKACDKFSFSLGEEQYSTILLNDEIAFEDGLSEYIYLDEPEETETEYKYADSTDKKINKAYILVDKQNKKIAQLTQETTENAQKLTQVEQTVEGVNTKVSSVETKVEEVENTANTAQSTADSAVEGVNNITTTTAEAEGKNIHLTDSAEEPLVDISLHGESTQETRSGKNIFDKDNIEDVYGSSSVTVSSIDTGLRITATSEFTTNSFIFRILILGKTEDYLGKTIRINSTAIPSTSLRSSINLGTCNEDGTTRKTLVSATGTTNEVSNLSIEYTMPSEIEDMNEYICMWVYLTLGTTAPVNSYMDYTDLIVTIDNEDMTYEPYGVMPSPEFPSEIETVAGDVEVKVEGKNVYNNATKSNNYSLTWAGGNLNGEAKSVCSDFIEKNDLTKIYSNYYFYAGFYDEEKNYLGNGTDLVFVFTPYYKDLELPTNENVKYFKLCFRSLANSDIDMTTLTDIMVTRTQEELTPYEPYQSQTYNFTLTDEYCSLPNGVKDTIEKVDGVWNRCQRVRKFILDGTEVFNDYNTSIYNPLNLCCYQLITDLEKNNNQLGSMSTHFKINTLVNMNNEPKAGEFAFYTDGASYLNKNRLFFCVSYETIGATLEDNLGQKLNKFKSYLAEQYANGTPVIVYYELATPIYTEITDEDLLNFLNNIKTYKDITNITSDIYAKITYMRDNGLDVYETKQNAEKKYTETTQKFAEQQITIDGITEQVSETKSSINELTGEMEVTNQKIASQQTTIDGISQKVSNMADLTQIVIGNKSVSLANCIEGYLLSLNIKGNNTVFYHLYPSDDLYPSDNLYPEGDSLITVADKDGNITEYKLGITDVLRQNENTYDEYILEDGQAKVIKRINEDGTIKETEEIEDLGELNILLKEGTNTIEIKNYTAEISVKYVIRNDYTNIVATKVEMDSKINQTAQEISIEVNKKVNNEELGTKMVQNYESVQIAWNKISEFIQFINAQLQIKNTNKRLLMALDKTGMHFYDNAGNEIGDIGLIESEDEKQISFAINGDNTGNSMVWGIYTKTNNEKGFIPIFRYGEYNIEEGTEVGGFFLLEAPIVLQKNYLALGHNIDTDPNIRGVDNGTNKNISFNNTDNVSFYDSLGNILLVFNNEYFKFADILEMGINLSGSYSFDFKDNNIINVANMATTSNIDYFSSITGESLYVSVKDGGGFSLYPSSSDKNLKKNIKNSNEKAIEKIKKIKHRQFDWKSNGKHQNIGYIAQEMEQIDKSFIYHNTYKKEGKDIEDWQINVLSVLTTTTKAIQEQQEMIENQQEQIKKLERIQELERKNSDGKDNI